MEPLLSPNEQFAALGVLDYLSDLFTAAGKETFSRTEVLILIDTIKSDPEIFDPDVVIAQQNATSDLE